MPADGEVKYLVLADRAVPYLLARVRWPDVAQAISAASPDWLDDSGLFDLPYDPSAVTVSFPQAASVAAGWGRQLHAEAAEGVPAYIRRMPANWSDLSPSERRAWGIEFVGRRRAPARQVRRPIAPSEDRLAAAQGRCASGRRARRSTSAAQALACGRSRWPTRQAAAASVATERRSASGCGSTAGRTSESGPHHHLRRARRSERGRGAVRAARGGRRWSRRARRSAGRSCSKPRSSTSRICLDVAGRISWQPQHRGRHALRHRLRASWPTARPKGCGGSWLPPRKRASMSTSPR